jgi:hypothetical protein
MSLPFNAIDGTFLKTRFGQTLLVAVGRDVNNGSFLLAWVVVEGESANAWGVFFRPSNCSHTRSQHRGDDIYPQLRQGHWRCRLLHSSS